MGAAGERGEDCSQVRAAKRSPDQVPQPRHRAPRPRAAVTPAPSARGPGAEAPPRRV